MCEHGDRLCLGLGFRVRGHSQYTSTTFRSRGGYLLLCASATGYSTGGQAMTGMNVSLDGTPYGTIEIFANRKNWHLAFVPADFLLTSIPSGVHLLPAGTGRAGTEHSGGTGLSAGRPCRGAG